MSDQISVGCIVTIGKAKTLWEVTYVSSLGASLVKVDGDGYVNLTRPLTDLKLQAGPCQDVTLWELIEAKRRAREAALDVGEELRLWPAPLQVAEVREAADAAYARWLDAHRRHNAGRAWKDIETAIRERRERKEG